MSISINHAAVFVRDLDAVRVFYETYFQAVSNEQYHNPRTGLRTYFLAFDGGCRLELMTRPNVHAEPAHGQTGWAHVAFSLGSVEGVDRMVGRLRDGGYTVSEPRWTGDGYYEAVALDPEGNQVEITV